MFWECKKTKFKAIQIEWLYVKFLLTIKGTIMYKIKFIDSFGKEQFLKRMKRFSGGYFYE